MTITINLKGRLGNQLFQYAVLRNLSIVKGYDFYINTNIDWHGQPNLLKYFNIKSSSPLNTIQYRYTQPLNSNFFDKNIFNIQDNTLLDGHFENIQYFKENEEIIKNELTIKDEAINSFTDNYIRDLSEDGSKVVGIHFRRGDLISQVGDINTCNTILTNYATQSLESIIQSEPKIKIIIFTGGFRTSNGTQYWINNNLSDDIQWIKNFISNHYLKNKMIISPGSHTNNELIDYDLFSKCDYNIITYPSTFTWMAAYVNKKNYKKVYNNTYPNINILNFNVSKLLSPEKF